MRQNGALPAAAKWLISTITTFYLLPLHFELNHPSTHHGWMCYCWNLSYSASTLKDIGKIIRYSPWTASFELAWTAFMARPGIILAHASIINLLLALAFEGIPDMETDSEMEAEVEVMEGEADRCHEIKWRLFAWLKALLVVILLVPIAYATAFLFGAHLLQYLDPFLIHLDPHSDCRRRYYHHL